MRTKELDSPTSLIWAEVDVPPVSFSIRSIPEQNKLPSIARPRLPTCSDFIPLVAAAGVFGHKTRSFSCVGGVRDRKSAHAYLDHVDFTDGPLRIM